MIRSADKGIHGNLPVLLHLAVIRLEVAPLGDDHAEQTVVDIGLDVGHLDELDGEAEYALEVPYSPLFDVPVDGFLFMLLWLFGAVLLLCCGSWSRSSCSCFGLGAGFGLLFLFRWARPRLGRGSCLVGITCIRGWGWFGYSLRLRLGFFALVEMRDPYTFRISDSRGNGLGNFFGDGSLEFSGDGQGEEVVVGFDGDVFSGKAREFAVDGVAVLGLDHVKVGMDLFIVIWAVVEV